MLHCTTFYYQVHCNILVEGAIIPMNLNKKTMLGHIKFRQVDLITSVAVRDFLPLRPPGWRSIFVTVRAERAAGLAADLRNPYLCNHLTDLLCWKFCGIVWACSCALSWSFAHFPIWACPWAKNFAKFSTNWVRLCRMHISETAWWFTPFKISWICLDL